MKTESKKVDYSETFDCATCKQTFHCWIEGKFSGNYGMDKEGRKHCFDCCGKNDLADALATGKWIGYLTANLPDTPGFTHPKYFASNWPGTLKVPVFHASQSRHNMGGRKTHVWFKLPDDNFVWYGYQIGNNNQILHARRTKKKEF